MDFGFYNMDCMKGMAQFPDKYFDLGIVDPPYGIHDKITNNNKLKISKGNKFAIRYDQKVWDKKRPDKKYFIELFRISKNQIICGANYFVEYLPVSRGWIFWNKLGDNLTVVNNELIFTSFDVSIKQFTRCHGLDKGFMRKDKPIHPTEKPIALYRWTLQNYAKPGWKLLDTHVGSASSLIAFEWEGFFDYVGFELDKDYYHDAKNRLETWRERHFGQYKLALAV